MTVPAHEQQVTHTYLVHYPTHAPRKSDPYYRTFEAYRKRTVATARCQFAIDRHGDDSECDLAHPLELHHHHIELAMMNEVDFALLEPFYPGISNPRKLGEWINGADNLVYYCRWHHRGHAGVHSATSSDFEASHFVRHLIS